MQYGNRMGSRVLVPTANMLVAPLLVAQGLLHTNRSAVLKLLLLTWKHAAKQFVGGNFTRMR